MSTTQRQTHEKKFDSLELFQNEEEVQDTHPKISHLSVKPCSKVGTITPASIFNNRCHIQSIFRSVILTRRIDFRCL